MPVTKGPSIDRLLLDDLNIIFINVHGGLLAMSISSTPSSTKILLVQG